MKFFEMPVIEVTEFAIEDVITTSTDIDREENETPGDLG